MVIDKLKERQTRRDPEWMVIDKLKERQPRRDPEWMGSYLKIFF